MHHHAHGKSQSAIPFRRMEEVVASRGMCSVFWLFEPRRVCRKTRLLGRMEHHVQDDEQVLPPARISANMAPKS